MMDSCGVIAFIILSAFGSGWLIGFACRPCYCEECHKKIQRRSKGAFDGNPGVSGW